MPKKHILGWQILLPCGRVERLKLENGSAKYEESGNLEEVMRA